eukprot:scaffold7945_cov119-Isochrysis_galbana.AAC.4
MDIHDGMTVSFGAEAEGRRSGARVSGVCPTSAAHLSASVFCQLLLLDANSATVLGRVVP